MSIQEQIQMQTKEEIARGRGAAGTIAGANLTTGIVIPEGDMRFADKPEPNLSRNQRRAKERFEKELDTKCSSLVLKYKLAYNAQVRQAQESKIAWEGRTDYQKKKLEKTLLDLEHDWQAFVRKVADKARKDTLHLDMSVYGNWFLRRIHALQSGHSKKS